MDIGDYNDGNLAPVKKKGVPILSHYCSIITRLEFSPDGQYIVSSDRNFKIRVTLFPKDTLKGAHEIKSFCLGHSEFVSCLAFVCCHDYPQGLLVSGSGDSTAGLLSSDQRQDEVLPAVNLCATSDGSLVAAIQSLPGIVVLRCNFSTKTLSIDKVVSISGETFIPTSIGAASSVPFLWMVMGASTSNTTDSLPLARLRVISGFASETLVVEDTQIPGGEPLLQALQGRLSIGEEAFSTAAEAVKAAMRSLLIKKQYSSERRQVRKRGRDDKKNQPPTLS